MQEYIDISNEFWVSIQSLIYSASNKIALTDNLNGLYWREFNLIYHYFNYWSKWVRRECGILSQYYHTENKAVKQAMIKVAIIVPRIEPGRNLLQITKSGSTGIEIQLNWVVVSDLNLDYTVQLSWQINLQKQDLPCKMTIDYISLK